MCRQSFSDQLWAPMVMINHLLTSPVVISVFSVGLIWAIKLVYYVHKSIVRFQGLYFFHVVSSSPLQLFHVVLIPNSTGHDIPFPLWTVNPYCYGIYISLDVAASSLAVWRRGGQSVSWYQMGVSSGQVQRRLESCNPVMAANILFLDPSWLSDQLCFKFYSFYHNSQSSWSIRSAVIYYGDLHIPTVQILVDGLIFGNHDYNATKHIKSRPLWTMWPRLESGFNHVC